LELEGKTSGQERLIETLLSQLESVSAELSRFKKSAGERNASTTASFRKRFLTITKRTNNKDNKTGMGTMGRSLRRSFKPVLRKYMEDLGISPSSLSTSKSLRRKYNTMRKGVKAAAEASIKRREDEDLLMEKVNVKTMTTTMTENKIKGMKPKQKDSSFVPSGLHRTIRWRFVKRSKILCEHLDSVKCLSLENDTSRLLSGGDDGLVKLWSLKSRSSKTLCTFRGHQGSVFTTAFLPHGNSCASAGADGLIQIWRLPRLGDKPLKGEQLVQMETTLRGHQDAIWSLATHNQHTHKLLSGSADGTIRLF